MNKIVQRLLIFCIGVPLFAGIILLLPYHHHLALNLVTVILSALGAAEFSVLLAQKQLSVSKTEAAVLGALPPAAMILIVNFALSDLLLFAVIAAVVSWLLMSRVFSPGNTLDNFLNRLVAGFAVLIYPGMLMAWVVRMSLWEQNAGIIILTFLVIVFCNDGAAWAAGMLFGKGNQGIIPASPNKSVAGFIGGALASIGIGAIAVLIFPDVFVPKYPVIAGPLLGFLTGIAAAFGDLAESAIKRSSGLKDSGNIIPGRGGVLDSLDSVAFAAPVFYLVFCLLFVRV